MSRGVNKVIVIGNVGGEPESRAFPDGSSVTNISVATSESWRDKQTGQQQERTEWHRVVLRDRGNYRLGQIAAQYLKKGSKVYIEGSLRTRKYQAQDGSDRYITEIIADQMQMLDSREGGGQSGGNYQPSNNYGQSNNYTQSAPQPQSAPAQPQSAPPAPGFDDFDDDIPF